MFQLHVTEIAQVLQSVVAPAFLLAGIGTFVNVMAQRLARIVDRARELETEGFADDSGAPHATTRSGLRERLYDVLVERARLINRALTLCTATAITVCALIALQFVDAMLQLDLSGVVSLVFVGTMLCLMGGLVIFLREVFLSTDVLRRAYLRADHRPLRKAA